MRLSFQSDEELAHISIDDDLTMTGAAELLEQIISLLPKHQGIVLDLSGVREIDTAGLQILIAGKEEAKAQKKRFCIINHSPPVVSALQLLNLIAFFGDPIIEDLD